MYTIQALWTMARENLDITVVLLDNAAYRILNVEFARMTGGPPAGVAKGLFDLHQHPGARRAPARPPAHRRSVAPCGAVGREAGYRFGGRPCGSSAAWRNPWGGSWHGRVCAGGRVRARVPAATLALGLGYRRSASSRWTSWPWRRAWACPAGALGPPALLRLGAWAKHRRKDSQGGQYSVACQTRKKTHYFRIL